MMIQYGVPGAVKGRWCPAGRRAVVPAGPGRARCGPGSTPAAPGRRRRAAEQHCCVPSGCAGETIDPDEPGDAVRVVCSNPTCVVGSWMHADCYDDWLQRILFYIRSAHVTVFFQRQGRIKHLVRPTHFTMPGPQSLC